MSSEMGGRGVEILNRADSSFQDYTDYFKCVTAKGEDSQNAERLREGKD